MMDYASSHYFQQRIRRAVRAAYARAFFSLLLLGLVAALWVRAGGQP